jgi:glycosyltransferase involved in cell wall biosynthesis
MTTVNNKPFLCLNMIVKNESKIIVRLIESVLPIIDSYCICDTGSTDNTIEIIRSFCKERKLPGEVFEIPFRDFGYNRTKSLERAAKWGQYALLLDADMVLEISPKFNKKDLIFDLYQVKQKNACLDYYNTRVVRTDKGITCVGVTHEYYNAPPGTTSCQLDTLEINDIGDGGAKSDKYDRDIRLLRKGIMEDPKNVRYHFYLANSYRDLGTMTSEWDRAKIYLKKAIKWYKRRIEMGGWDEELLMCCLEIGNINQKLGKPEKSVYWWIEGYLYRKTRSETLYELIKFYREKDPRHAQIAGVFYDIAKNIPYPTTDALFIRKAVYDHLLDYEYSILAYYMGTDVDHYRYLDLLGKHENQSNILSNYKFYAKKMSSLNPLKKSLNEPATIEYHTDKFNPSTPCIIPMGDGYLMNQRYVNYFIEPNGAYTCNFPITTFNRRFFMDHDFNITKSFDFDELPKVVDRYAGIEDVKIFPFKDKVMFFGTEQNLQTTNLCVSGGVYPTTDESHALVSTIYQSPTGSNCEKNWCYLEHQGELKVVYKWHPLTIGSLVGDQLNITHTDSELPPFLKHCRGSSNGFTYGDEIWFVVHMVEYSSPRNYYHCLVMLDRETLKYKRHSILFKFEDSLIEYCLGMIVEKDRMIFGFSKMDRETTLCSYSRPNVDQFLFPK